MNRDTIDINDFTVLVEVNKAQEVVIDACSFDEPVVAVAFYGSGNVDLSMEWGQQQKQYKGTKGLALSFYADETVNCVHKVAPEKPLECIVVATALRKLNELPHQEGEIFSEMLNELVNPSDNYVEGPRFFMNPEMQQVVDSIFANSFTGKTKMMFFRSQITVLLSHFFGQLALSYQQQNRPQETDKLELAKEILAANLDNPPSLTELAKSIGLNTTKLKKDFKAVFGVPVFKYLQNERLTTAHEMIQKQQATVQEAAWQVGYDSLSSFSNAFTKKFGYRPSQVK
ncbi:helix-turn-helix transcriptional regulator [Gilvibacter sp.]|uniref:helix-turn-helix transcriptional regulator n=1 Tax=Gilvibacter sp. TaxID=2729997 RepID=UPI003F4A694E